MTIRNAALAGLFAFAGWVALLAGVTLFSDAAPAVIILFPNDTLVENLPEDVELLSATGFSVTLASDSAGFAKSLYQKGAWIVLPAGLSGCG